MARRIDLNRQAQLSDYDAVAHLAPAAQKLRAEAPAFVRRLAGRTVWMVNSTETGGGVAELLPTTIALLRDLGVNTEWVVIESERPEFFALTKRIHNMIHGMTEPGLEEEDRELYESVSRTNADALLRLVSPGDVLVIHDPQPLGAGALVRQESNVRAVWRCHIGLGERLPCTAAAWNFLRRYAISYDHAVFSSPEYSPGFLAGRVTVNYPAIDPLSHKNRDLSLQKLVGILCDSSLAVPHWPLLTPPFPNGARRLQVSGDLASATQPEDFGLLARPVIVQVSRWDRLKGFGPLLEAFRLLKIHRQARTYTDSLHERRIDLARLALAGPDPSSIQDDPEGLDVFEKLRRRWLELEPELQQDIALLSLPMQSRKQNALMVNALQRCATIVAQNSLREGFGLTAAEAMWKRVPVLGNTRAVGIRHQVRDGLDGRLVDDPEDVEALATAMHEMLSDERALDQLGSNGARRVHDEFLIFKELRGWLEVLAQA